MPTAIAPANTETDFLADSFLADTGIIFNHNERVILHSALSDFLTGYTEAVVTSTVQAIARTGPPEGVWI